MGTLRLSQVLGAETVTRPGPSCHSYESLMKNWVPNFVLFFLQKESEFRYVLRKVRWMHGKQSSLKLPNPNKYCIKS